MRNYGITPVAEYNTFKEEIEQQPYPTKPFRLACLVTGSQHRVSRAGKKFGVLMLEDFSGKMELTLFGDMYVKFANYFETGNCLYITGKFEKWEYRNDWNFKVIEICLLETIKRSLTRQIQFNINPKLFTVNQFSFIERNIKKNPGKTRLKFVFHEKKDQKMVVLSTIDKGFEMNDEMAAFLLENPDMEVNVETA